MALKDKIAFGISLPHRSPDRIDMADVKRVAQRAERPPVISGRGWGHGVGLCQNGAYGMALGGATYDAILRHYYRGVEIVPASGVKAVPSTLR